MVWCRHTNKTRLGGDAHVTGLAGQECGARASPTVGCQRRPPALATTKDAKGQDQWLTLGDLLPSLGVATV